MRQKIGEFHATFTVFFPRSRRPHQLRRFRLDEGESRFIENFFRQAGAIELVQLRFIFKQIELRRCSSHVNKNTGLRLGILMRIEFSKLISIDRSRGIQDSFLRQHRTQGHSSESRRRGREKFTASFICDGFERGHLFRWKCIRIPNHKKLPNCAIQYENCSSQSHRPHI